MIRTVTTAAELSAAIAAAQPGDRIACAPGAYGTLTLTGKRYAAPVAIEAAQALNPPTFAAISLTSCSGITFAGIAVAFQPTAAMRDSNPNPAIKLNTCTDITIANSELRGGLAPAGHPQAGHAMGRGVWMAKSQRIAIRDCVFTGFKYSTFANGSSDLILERNDFSKFRCCAFSGGGNTRVRIEGGEMREARPWNWPAADHGDFIHFYTDKAQVGPSDQIVIRGVYMEQGGGTPIMGLSLQDQGGKGYTNVVIEGNVIHTGNGQGIRIAAARSGRIVANTIATVPGLPKVVPKIVARGCGPLTIDRNLWAGITGLTPTGKNLVAQAANAGAADHVTKLLLNPLAPAPKRTDFAAILAGVGYGAL